MKSRQTLTCNEPIIGRKVRLDRLAPDHTDFLLSAFTNDEFWNVYRTNQNRSIDKLSLLQQLEFEYERLPSQVGKIEWLVSRTDNTKDEPAPPIGLASLSAFDAAHSRAEFMLGIFDSEQIHTGIGLEISLLVFDYAFNLERLRKLVSIVYASNPRAQKSTLALGFTNEGVLETHLRSSPKESLIHAFKNGLLSRDFRTNARLASLSSRLLGYDVTAEPSEFNLHTEHLTNSTFGLRAKFTIEKTA